MRRGSRGGSWEHRRCHAHIIYKTQKELTAKQSSGDLGRWDAQTITMELMTQAGEARRRLLPFARQGKKARGSLVYSRAFPSCGKGAGDIFLPPKVHKLLLLSPCPPAVCCCVLLDGGSVGCTELLCISTSMVKTCPWFASPAIAAACSGCSSCLQAGNSLSHIAALAHLLCARE